MIYNKRFRSTTNGADIVLLRLHFFKIFARYSVLRKSAARSEIICGHEAVSRLGNRCGINQFTN